MKKLEYLNLVPHLVELKLHQNKSKEELAQIQLRKLKKIVKYAYEHVPYYRNLFDSIKFDPEKIKSLDDLQKIPILTKKELQANYDKLIADNVDINRCEISTTTGSTGIPLKVCNDEKSMYYSRALEFFAFFEGGLKVTDRFINLSSFDKQTYLGEKKLGFLRADVISLYNSNNEIIHMLEKYKPDVIYSFPTVFRNLSDIISSKSIIRPRLIFTHGETLTESNRKKIKSAFGCPVYNTYGSAEFIRIAFECEEHSGYHILTDSVVIEFVKDGEIVDPGLEGEIIVTGLYNYAMPLLRYNIGDVGIASYGECPCGRSWPMIKSVEGRSDDYVTLPSGRIISPRNINVIEDIPEIKEYRTIQERKGNFLVLVVPGEKFNITTEKQIEEKIKMGCLGEDIQVEIKIVDEIPKERTGKTRTIISNVKNHE